MLITNVCWENQKVYLGFSSEHNQDGLSVIIG